MMKKVTFLVLALLGFMAMNVQAQDGSFSEGQIDVNLGIGLLPTFIASGVDAGLPPISISVDYGIKERISLGGYLGYASATSEFGGFGTSYKWKYTYIILGARGAYHFTPTHAKIDAYGGAMLGYNVASVKFDGDDSLGGFDSPTAGGLAWSLFGGARYRFSDKMGIYGELGYGISIIQLGLNIKL